MAPPAEGPAGEAYCTHLNVLHLSSSACQPQLQCFDEQSKASILRSNAVARPECCIPLHNSKIHHRYKGFVQTLPRHF